MSLPKSSQSPGVVVQKPRSNVYTVMLFISLIAVIIACVLLWLELKRFGDWPPWKTPAVGMLSLESEWVPLRL